MFSVRNISCLLFVIVAGIKNESSFCGQKVRGREHPYIYYEDEDSCIFSAISNYKHDKNDQTRLEEICGYTSADGKKGYKLRLASFSDPVVYKQAMSDMEQNMGQHFYSLSYIVGLQTIGPQLPFFCGNNFDEMEDMKSTWKWNDGAPMNNKWCSDISTVFEECEVRQREPVERIGVMIFTRHFQCFLNNPITVPMYPVCEYYKSSNCDTEEIVRACETTRFEHVFYQPTCLDLEDVQKCIIERVVENCGSKSLAREECEQATEVIFERNPELGSTGCDRSADKCR